jgi:hypothetical protein
VLSDSILPIVSSILLDQYHLGAHNVLAFGHFQSHETCLGTLAPKDHSTIIAGGRRVCVILISGYCRSVVI